MPKNVGLHFYKDPFLEVKKEPFIGVHCALEGFEKMQVEEAKEKFGVIMAEKLLQFSETGLTVVYKNDVRVHVVKIEELEGLLG